MRTIIPTKTIVQIITVKMFLLGLVTGWRHGSITPPPTSSLLLLKPTSFSSSRSSSLLNYRFHHYHHHVPIFFHGRSTTCLWATPDNGRNNEEKAAAVVTTATTSSSSSSLPPRPPPPPSSFTTNDTFNTAKQQQTQASSSSSSSRKKSNSSNNTKKRTLYEILGANPTDTRDELKRKYIALAKKSHPDALRQYDASLEVNNNGTRNGTDLVLMSNPSPPGVAGGGLDFTEIAAAWRILSDEKQRKQYDRSLRAEKISADIIQWAGAWSEQARPVADVSVELLEKVAFPFLRRTTATTLAGITAAAQDLAKQQRNARTGSNGIRNSIGGGGGDTTVADSETGTSGGRPNQSNTPSGGKWTFQKAMEAAQRAGRAVDKMELLEKAQDLETQAIAEFQQAMDLQKQMNELAEQRLKLSLHTAKSGITSSEAMILLEQYNQTTTKTVWDTGLLRQLRQPVEDIIQELRRAEESFVEAQQMDTSSQDSLRACVQEQLSTKNALEMAEDEEEEARRQYEAAKQKVLQLRISLDGATKVVMNAEAMAKKSNYEMERRSVWVEHVSEKVRNALKQKEKVVLKAHGLTDVVADSMSEAENEQRLAQLSELRNIERQMAETSTQMEDKATRLLSRAKKLRSRANELENL